MIPARRDEIFRQWSRAVARPISVAHLSRALEGVAPEQIALCLDATGPTPVDRAAQVIEAVLEGNPRARDRGLDPCRCGSGESPWGRTHVLPLLSLALKARDLRLRGR